MKMPDFRFKGAEAPRAGKDRVRTFKNIKVLDIKEAFELKWKFVPRAVVDDGGRRRRFIEVI